VVKNIPNSGDVHFVVGQPLKRKKVAALSVAMLIGVKNWLSNRTIRFTHQPLPKLFMNLDALASVPYGHNLNRLSAPHGWIWFLFLQPAPPE
jgi:hypothetical protein